MIKIPWVGFWEPVNGPVKQALNEKGVDIETIVAYEDAELQLIENPQTEYPLVIVQDVVASRGPMTGIGGRWTSLCLIRELKHSKGYSGKPILVTTISHQLMAASMAKVYLAQGADEFIQTDGELGADYCAKIILNHLGIE
jgi:hypothetical protein